MIKSIFTLLALSLTCALGLAQEAEAEKKPWTNKSGLQMVYSDGNSTTTTVGLSNKYKYNWDEDATFSFNVSGVRSRNDTYSRSAMIEGDQIVILESEESETTEERYRTQLHFKDKIVNKLHWFTGAEWQRNDISGIDARYIVTVGLGNTWFDTKQSKFVTHYGVEYVHEEFSENMEDEFAALAVGYDYMRQVTKSTRFDQVFKVSLNGEETDDYRAELESVLTVSINTKMALTTKLHFFYDNEPVIENVVVTNATNGSPATVEFELEGLETLFTTSLVVSW